MVRHDFRMEALPILQEPYLSPTAHVGPAHPPLFGFEHRRRRLVAFPTAAYLLGICLPPQTNALI